MSLKGGRELRARLRAIKLTFKPAGKEWADEAVSLARAMVPVQTGRLRASIKRKNDTQRKATVKAHYSAFFVDKGTRAHSITARKSPSLIFQGRGGRTIFARKVNHPRTSAQPFRDRAAREALRRKPMSAELIKLWNAAA